MQKTLKNEKNDQFVAQLNEYKEKIDADIEQFCQDAITSTHEGYGEHAAEAVQAYCSVLGRGGKRIRGALTITAYKMLGGTDESVARQAAMVIEMLHAYILMVDDIQDRSDVRRGGPTAHIMIKEYHEKNHLRDSAEHFGQSIAMNGFLFGCHSALNILTKMNVDPQVKLNAITNINNHFITTVHGQSLDIFNEVLETADEESVNNVLLWKTAYYTFMNPLQLGAILAGGKPVDEKQLEQYSLSAGRVFQITDDILGTFGEEALSGKSPLDDVKEGKRTLLVIKAIEMAQKSDSYFLEQMLGNKKLTQYEFERCKEIFDESGALEYAQKQAKDSVVDALASLDQARASWGDEQVAFLEQLVQFLINRKA